MVSSKAHPLFMLPSSLPMLSVYLRGNDISVIFIFFYVHFHFLLCTLVLIVLNRLAKLVKAEAGVEYVDLVATFADQDDKEVEGPEVRFFLKAK